MGALSSRCPPPEPAAGTIRLRVLSLGAGVQSTTLALMAAHGIIGPMPDCAVFADTGWKPQAVYRHLAWLMAPGVLPFSGPRRLGRRPPGRPPGRGAGATPGVHPRRHPHRHSTRDRGPARRRRRPGRDGRRRHARPAGRPRRHRHDPQTAHRRLQGCADPPQGARIGRDRRPALAHGCDGGGVVGDFARGGGAHEAVGRGLAGQPLAAGRAVDDAARLPALAGPARLSGATPQRLHRLPLPLRRPTGGGCATAIPTPGPTPWRWTGPSAPVFAASAARSISTARPCRSTRRIWRPMPTAASSISGPKNARACAVCSSRSP